MLDYCPPSEVEIAQAGVQAHFLGAYFPWDSHRNALDEVLIIASALITLTGRTATIRSTTPGRGGGLCSVRGEYGKSKPGQ